MTIGWFSGLVNQIYFGANRVSLRCTQLIAGVLGRAGESGRLARIQQTKVQEQMRPLEEMEYM